MSARHFSYVTNYILFSATPPHKPVELISGVFYQAQYLGSTFIFVHNSCEGLVWTQHAHDVIALIKVNGAHRICMIM